LIPFKARLKFLGPQFSAKIDNVTSFHVTIEKTSASVSAPKNDGKNYFSFLLAENCFRFAVIFTSMVACIFVKNRIHECNSHAKVQTRSMSLFLSFISRCLSLTLALMVQCVYAHCP